MSQQITFRGFEWKILAIGGSSGTGKTMVAQEIAKHISVSVLLVDDIRLALQQMTTPAEQPGLHFFSSAEEQGIWEQTPQHICNGLITVAEAISPALETIMAHHVVVSEVGSLILEGDGILPQMIARPRFSELKRFYGLKLNNEILSVFLYEPDKQVILQNMQKRGRAFQDLPPAQQYHLACASWLYGQWLRQEAQTYHLPVVTSRPWNTLIDRIISVVG